MRSWMEGWRLRCPSCGAGVEDARPMNRLERANPADPLLVRVADDAFEGERIITQGVRHQANGPLTTLMRSLLLPRARPRQTPSIQGIPRLLDVVVPGFDEFLRTASPGFRVPGTLLLPISLRIPVLAGIARVARRLNYWPERLLGAAGDGHRSGLAACFKDLGANLL
jgi:hypothetical protein